MPLKLTEALERLPSPLTSLVVGGTSGIGAGVAIALAQHPNPKSQVIIAGRRQDAGKQVCDAARKAASKNAANSAIIRFMKVDATLMTNIRAFCDQLKKELGEEHRQLDVLVLSQGVLRLTRQDTSEGIETAFALNYYGRMCFIRELTARGLLSPQCLVINVLNGKAGDPSGETIDFTDLGMRRTGILAIPSVIKQNFAMSDIMIQDMGVEQHQDGERRTYVHDYPGFVKTDLVKSPLLKFVFGITSLFRNDDRYTSIETAGETIVAGGVALLLRTRAGEKAYWYMDDRGEEIAKCSTGSDVRTKVREHTWALIDQALGDSVRY
jgi:hypothetical protein